MTEYLRYLKTQYREAEIVVGDKNLFFFVMDEDGRAQHLDKHGDPIYDLTPKERALCDGLLSNFVMESIKDAVDHRIAQTPPL